MKVAALSLLAILAVSAIDDSGYKDESEDRREIIEQFMSKEDVDRNRNAMRILHVEESEVEANVADLKMRYFEINGRELTDEEIDAAIDDAREKAGPRFGPDYKVRMLNKVPEFEDFEMAPQVVDAKEDERHLRRMQFTPARPNKMFIVAGNSPGWEYNRGRNEFFCVSAESLDNQNYLPRPGQKITLRNCLTTPAKFIAWRYTSDFEIRMQNDGVYYTWCLETKKARRNMKAEINTCNFFDGNQVWNLFNQDRTWRPGNNADLDLCMTSQDNPSDGGTIQLEKCEEQYNFPNPTGRRLGKTKKRRKDRRDRRKERRYYRGPGSNRARLRQVWVTCVETNNCGIDDFGFVSCNFVTNCQPVSGVS